VAGVVVLGLLGDVAYAIYAAPQRNKPVSKARRLRRALARLIDPPEEVTRPCRRRSSARSARRSWRASLSRRRSTARHGGPASSAAR